MGSFKLGKNISIFEGFKLEGTKIDFILYDEA